MIILFFRADSFISGDLVNRTKAFGEELGYQLPGEESAVCQYLGGVERR